LDAQPTSKPRSLTPNPSRNAPNPRPKPENNHRPIERREKFKAEIDALARAKEELEIEYSLLVDKQKQAKAEKALLGEEVEALRGRFDKATVDYVRRALFFCSCCCLSSAAAAAAAVSPAESLHRRSRWTGRAAAFTPLLTSTTDALRPPTPLNSPKPPKTPKTPEPQADILEIREKSIEEAREQLLGLNVRIGEMGEALEGAHGEIDRLRVRPLPLFFGVACRAAGAAGAGRVPLLHLLRLRLHAVGFVPLRFLAPPTHAPPNPPPPSHQPLQPKNRA